MVTDFHSHILPGVDDGSSSLEQSLQMLRMEAEQGIRHVVATPHFYARYDAPETFLEKRSRAEALLREAMEKNPGSVYLPVKIKDGQLCAGESLATLEMFGSLESYIRRLASGHMNCLKDGNIDINPFKYGKDSCEYCENYPICRFDGKGRRYETVNDLEEAWQEIRKGEED